MSPSAVTLQILHDRFVAGLEGRLARLNSCLAALREQHDNDDTPDTVEEMMMGFHSLAGIGGSYGYASITDVARDGEMACLSFGGHATELNVDQLAGVLTTLMTVASSVTTGVAIRL
jgi:chemotaxis protein histidine kinase CheA